MTITRPLNEITFLDIYRAVECTPDEELFHFHENPNSLCPVGRNIHHVLDDKLARVQSAMEKELAAITLADVKKDTDMWIAKKKCKRTCKKRMYRDAALAMIESLKRHLFSDGKGQSILQTADVPAVYRTCGNKG